MAFDPSKFTVPTAKPLPVVLLLDVSGSMSGSKIDHLNQAVRDMLDTFAQEEKMETEILVSVITFGDEVLLYLPFTKASEVNWINLMAQGGTPLGTALQMAKAMIEDKQTTPGRAYRPTVVLVSDGQPNTVPWEQPLDAFIREGRSSKCDRMALAIDKEADRNVLTRFLEGTGNPLFEANQAAKIREFFKRVTMSVTLRTKSKDPNVSVPLTGTNPTPPSKPAEDDEEVW